jgi:hypothetical protein
MAFSLNRIAIGVLQQKRWAELSMQPPTPNKKTDPIRFVELTISPEFQKYIDCVTELMNRVKFYQP